MSYRELTMIDVKEVLRRWQAGQSTRRIPRDTGLDRKTVGRYVARAEELALRERALDDGDVHERSPVVSGELVAALERLRLGRIATTLPERLVLAEKQDMSFEDLMLLCLTDEIARRDGAVAENRAINAGLDPSMRIEHFDKSSKVTFEKRMLAELTSLRFLEARRHVVILGPVGVGKTFMASALGHLACQHGYDVLFHLGRPRRAR